MAKLRCAICEESLLVENFRFFNCGHGLCEHCLHRTCSESTCPFCRQPKGISHQIFLNFSEPTVNERASLVADGLDRMDAYTPAASLERAVRKLKDVIQYVDEANANDLLEAARNLEERVLPLSSMLELERADNLAYRRQIADLEAKLKLTETLDAEVTRLRVRLGEAQKNYESAALLAEKANRRAARRLEDNKRLDELVEKQRRACNKESEEVGKIQVEFQNKEAEVRLLKTKLRALSKSRNRPGIHAEDPDASLLVEPPVKHDLDLDLDGSPEHRLKTRTNLPLSQFKKRKLVAPITVAGRLSL